MYRAGSDEPQEVLCVGLRDVKGRDLILELLDGNAGSLGTLRLTRPHQLWVSEDWSRAEDWGHAVVRELLLLAPTDLVAPSPRARPRNDQLVGAIEGSDDGMLLINADRQVEWINDAFLGILELGRGEVQGATLTELQRRHSTSGVLRDLDASCEMGIDTTYERLRGRRDGRRIWVSVTFTVVRNDADEVTHYVAMARDVTEAREREFQLRRLHSAIHASSEGIAVVDDTRHFIVANRAFARLHGLDSDSEVVGRTWFELCEPALGTERLLDIEFAVESSSSWTGTFEMPQSRTAMRVVRHAITRLTDGGWIISAHDVTEQREIEQTLLRARDQAEATSQAQANFVTLVSHELRTPLSAIIGFSRVLLRNRPQALDARDQDFLSRIHANGRQLLGIIDGILTHARATAGRLQPRTAPTDIRAIVEDAAVSTHAEKGVGGVSFVLDVPSVPCGALVDPERFRQIVAILVDNALKFTESGEVVVRLSAQGDGTLDLRVSDTGVGIDADRLESIFKPFEQGGSGTARSYGGTGLGLPIVRALCSLMTLDVSVESAPGRGSTFHVRLPAAIRCPLPLRPTHAQVA